MNDQLKLLYEKYWDSFITNVYKATMKEGKPICAYPFLIQATKHYINASKRVMICGQETQVWGIEFHNPDLTNQSDLLQLYNKFVNKNHEEGLREKPGYNSPYWNFQWKIISASPEIGFVTQNLVKVGKYASAGCDNTIYELTKKYFPVWKDELKILKPDCILFLTGPHYDQRIREIVGEFKTMAIDGTDGFLDELIFNDPTMPKAYRTYHPRFLQSKKKYFHIAQKISDIVNNL